MPLPQAQLQLTAIFQSLGHLDPRFERDGDRLLVWSGSRTDMKRLKIEGDESVELRKRVSRRWVLTAAWTPATQDEDKKTTVTAPVGAEILAARQRTVSINVSFNPLNSL